MAGRPFFSNKLTPELQEKILDYLGEGLPVELVSALAGISKDTFYRWVRQGEKYLQDYEKSGGEMDLSEDQLKLLDFACYVEKARAEGQREHFMRMASSGRDDWRMHDRLLQLMNPTVFGAKMELDTKISGAIGVIPEGDPEISKAIGDILAKRKQQEPK